MDAVREVLGHWELEDAPDAERRPLTLGNAVSVTAGVDEAESAAEGEVLGVEEDKLLVDAEGEVEALVQAEAEASDAVAEDEATAVREDDKER